MCKHCVENAFEHISLHDCIANDIDLTDRNLCLYFEDGFWISANSKYNSCGSTVRTDRSKVKIVGLDKEMCEVFIFKKHYVLGKCICTTRKEISIDELIANVEKRLWKIEFKEQYFANHTMFFYGTINTNKKVWAFDFELWVDYDTTEYYWNNLMQDRKW